MDRTFEEIDRDFAPLFRDLARQVQKQYDDSSILEADDLLQEARIATLAAMENYDPTRGEFGAFLKTCVRNALRMYARRVLPHKSERDGDGWRWKRVYVDHDVPEKATADSSEVVLAIGELPSPYKDIATLLGQGYGQKEISSKLSISLRQLSTLKKEALARLQGLLSD